MLQISLILDSLVKNNFFLGENFKHSCTMSEGWLTKVSLTDTNRNEDYSISIFDNSDFSFSIISNNNGNVIHNQKFQTLQELKSFLEIFNQKKSI